MKKILKKESLYIKDRDFLVLGIIIALLLGVSFLTQGIENLVLSYGDGEASTGAIWDFLIAGFALVGALTNILAFTKKNNKLYLTSTILYIIASVVSFVVFFLFIPNIVLGIILYAKGENLELEETDKKPKTKKEKFLDMKVDKNNISEVLFLPLLIIYAIGLVVWFGSIVVEVINI